MSRRPLALGTIAFLALTVFVASGALREVDRQIAIAISFVPLQAMARPFRVVTTLGGVEATTVLALALAAVLTWREGRRGLVPLLIFVGILAEILLKVAVPQLLPPNDRSLLLQPDAAFVRRPGELYAFPSGNVLRTTFLALLLASLAREFAGVRAPLPAGTFAGVLMAWPLLAAFVQVHTVRHWPSDVLGGLLLGWLLAALAGWIYSRVPPAPRRAPRA